MSGPIALHSEVIPQLQADDQRRFQWENFARGLLAFSLGMAKKSAPCRHLGPGGRLRLRSIPGMNTPTALVVMLCYTLQLYFDSAATAIWATGLGLFFNVKLPQNFQFPLSP